MKEFKVYYAGEYDSASLINAGSKQEAAYLYFINHPKKRTIFVEGEGLLSESTISFKELANRYEDVPEILESLGSETDVLKETLEKEHNLRAAPKEDSKAANYFVRRIIMMSLTVIILLILLMLDSLRNG